MKSRVLKGYVLAVDLAAIASLLWLSREGIPDGIWTLLLLVSLAVLVGARPVRIPALKTEFAATHPFVLCALVALSPFASVLVALAGVAGMVAQLRRQGAMRVAFNVGAVPLSTAAAAGFYLALGGRCSGQLLQNLWPLTGATVVFFLTNTGLVAGAIALEKRASILAIWRKSFQWTAVSYFAGLSLAACLIFVLELMGPSSVALGVPPCWLLAAFYRTHRERLEEQRQRIQQIEALNADLERKVEDRTHELKGAMDRLETANQQLSQANERLIEASRAKSEFLANVSHELRTPLNAIIGFSELLADPSPEPLTSRQDEFVGDIHNAGEVLLNLINDILDLSKIEAGKMEAQRQEVDLQDSLQSAVSIIKPLAAKKKLMLVVSAEAQLPRVSLDPGMFRQILVNLLSNAVKFTSCEGRIEVQALCGEGRELIVAVRDTGIGIHPEHQERIFQEFFQVDGSYSRKYQGTGLGLALVKRMVDLHGGSLQVSSAPGVGSCFTCRFPNSLSDSSASSAAPMVTSGTAQKETSLAAPTATSGAARGAGTPAQGRPESTPDWIETTPAWIESMPAGIDSAGCRVDPAGGRIDSAGCRIQPAAAGDGLASRREGAGNRSIMVVEDNVVNRKLARNALRARGYEVIEAASGEEALQLLGHRRPDLILMDLHLPGLDGLEVTRRLKADPTTAGIRVVALTAYAQREVEDHARAAGCDGYITKPIRLSSFPGQIESYLSSEEKVA